MGIGGGGGGGVRPVRIEFEAQENITPALERIEQGGERVQASWEQAFAAATRAIDSAEKKTVEASTKAEEVLRRWEAEARLLEQQQERLARASTEAGNRINADFTLGLQSGLQSVQQLSAGISSFIERSSQLSTVGTAFARITESAGVASDELLSRMREATHGTINDLELMKQANLASFLVGKETIGQLPQLFEIAEASAKATGQSVEYLTNSIVTGIGRMSPRILDNLGLQIKLEDATSAYAATLGKTASQLTVTEQRQALLNEVLRQGKAMIEAAGGAGETMAEQMHSAETTLQNLADSAAGAASKLPGVRDGLVSVGIALKALEKAGPILMALSSIAQMRGALGGVGGSAAGGAGAAAGEAGLAEAGFMSTRQFFGGAAAGGAAAGASAIPWVAAGIVGISQLEDLLNGLHDLYLQDTAEETAAQDAAIRQIDEAMKTMDSRLSSTAAHARESLQAVQDSMLPASQYTFERFVLGETPEEAAKNLASVRSAFDDYILSHRKETDGWKASQSLLREHVQDLRDFYGDSAEGWQAIQNEIVKYANTMRIDPKEAIRELEDEDKRWAEQQKKNAREVEQARRAADRQRAADQREQENELKRALREREHQEQETIRTIASARKLAIQDELSDLKERSKILGDSIQDYFDTAQGAGRAASAVVDFSHSSVQALKDYKQAVQDALASGEAGAGLNTLKLSDFSLSRFGAAQRAREAVGPRPTVEGHTQALIDTGSPGIDVGTPTAVQDAIREYEQIQQRITDLQSALERQPPAVETLRRAFADTNVDLTSTTDAMTAATKALGDQSGAVIDTLKPLRDARDEFDLAGASIGDVGRSMGKIGLAGSSLKGDLSGAAQGVIDFGNAIKDKDTGTIAALQALGGAFATSEGAIARYRTAFVGVPGGLDEGIRTVRDRLGSGPDSLGAAIDTLDFKLRSLPSGFSDFRSYFDGLSANIGAATAVLPGLGDAALLAAPGISVLASSTGPFSTAISALASGGDQSPLHRVATDIGTLGSGAKDADMAFQNMGGQNGSVAGVGTAFNNLATGGQIGSLQNALDTLRTQHLDALGKPTAPGASTGTGSLFGVADAVTALGDKLGPDTTAGTLAYQFKSLFSISSTTGAASGPLAFVKDAFSSWATSSASLATGTASLDQVAKNVTSLVISLNTLKTSRTTQAQSEIYFPDPRASGGFVFDRWAEFLNGANGYQSKDYLSGTLQAIGADTYYDNLRSWWLQHNLPTGQAAPIGSFSSGARRAPAAVAGGPGGGITVNLGGVRIDASALLGMRSQQDVRRLAQEVSVQIGSQLKTALAGLVGRRM